MEWYKELPHIGYNLQGEKIIKPKSGDELDEFLQKMDNPDYWWDLCLRNIEIYAWNSHFVSN